MQLTIPREKLQDGLAAIGLAIPSRTYSTIDSHVLLEAETGGLRMTGFGDVIVRLFIPAEVDIPGMTTLPARKLAEWVKELKDSTVSLKVVSPDRVEVKAGRPRAVINGMPADDFPKLPNISFDAPAKIEGDTLLAMVQHVAFAAGSEDHRPTLKGALWEVEGGEMRMVATDGHKLARYTVPMKPGASLPATDRDVIIPSQVLQALPKLFSVEDEIEVMASGNYIAFRKENLLVIGRMVEGPYPNYRAVIAKDNDKALEAEKSALMAAIRRMAIVASSETHKVRIELNGKTSFKVQTPDLGEADEEFHDGSYVGDPLEIAFNSNYLLEVLKPIPTERVRISFKAAERAALLTPVAKDGEEAPDLTLLVMPLRLDS